MGGLIVGINTRARFDSFDRSGDAQFDDVVFVSGQSRREYSGGAQFDDVFVSGQSRREYEEATGLWLAQEGGLCLAQETIDSVPVTTLPRTETVSVFASWNGHRA